MRTAPDDIACGPSLSATPRPNGCSPVPHLARRLALAFAAGASALAGCSQALFFHPDSVERGDPADVGMAYVASDFRSADGTLLTGWFIPATEVDDAGAARGTVVQLHGNAENMTSHWRLVQWLPARGFNVFVFDYRGYGRSEGSPTPEGLAADSVAALRHVAAHPGVDPGRIVLLGQSLGGANAIVAAANEGCPPIAAIAIESTFRSYSAIANDKFPFAGSTMDDRFSPDRFIGRLSPTPVLFLHGTADRVIPVRHSQDLHALAGERSRLVVIPECGHLEVFQGRFAAAHRDLLEEFFVAALEEGSRSPCR